MHACAHVHLAGPHSAAPKTTRCARGRLGRVRRSWGEIAAGAGLNGPGARAVLALQEQRVARPLDDQRPVGAARELVGAAACVSLAVRPACVSNTTLQGNIRIPF